MDAPVDLMATLELLDEPWRPGVVARCNDAKLAVAKLHGTFVWHAHEDTDDCFLVLRGRVVIELRGRPDVELAEGQLFVVPRGAEHRPRADEPAWVLLIEREGTVNTGDAQASDLTAPERRL